MKISKIYPFSLFLIAGFVLFSCMKKELPVPKPNTDGVITQSIDLTPTYSKVIYFDLETNTVVGESNKLGWDLGFSCADGVPYIIMNGANIMQSAKITGKTFEQVTNASALNVNPKAQHPSGRMDSLAFLDGVLYVVDKGYDDIGNEMGYFKMEILEHTSAYFKGRFANLNGSNEQIITINKNSDYNFVYMKWNATGSITTPTIEPKKDLWDLVFTQYTEIFYEPEFIPYSVVGCLTNTYNTLSLKLSDKSFESITLEYAQGLTLTNDRDAIGYDWKNFLMDQDIYEIFSDKSYIIRDYVGFYYKLRFIDFYNNAGEKGSPTFEFQRLE